MNIKEIYNTLLENEYIDFGTIIPCWFLQNLFKSTINDGWTFLGPYLSLKQYIEDQGYFCTSENLEPGSLRILHANEMAERCANQNKLLWKKLSRLQNIMRNTDTSVMTEKEQQQHQHSLNIIALEIQSMKSVLNKIKLNLNLD